MDIEITTLAIDLVLTAIALLLACLLLQRGNEVTLHLRKQSVF